MYFNEYDPKLQTSIKIEVFAPEKQVSLLDTIRGGCTFLLFYNVAMKSKEFLELMNLIMG